MSTTTVTTTPYRASVAGPAGPATRFLRVVRSDLLVLRRRGLLLGTYAASAVVTALVTALTFATAGDEDSLPPGPAAGGTSPADLESSSGLLSGLVASTNILGVVAVCVAAAHVAGMFSSGTVRVALVRSPGRVVLALGKAAAVSLFLLGAVLSAAAAAALTALAVAPGSGVDTAAWGSSPLDVLGPLGQVALAVVGFGVVGTVLGLAVRAPIPAVAIGIGWLLPLETILVGTVDGSDRWLPGQLLSAVAQGGSEAVGAGTALVTVAAYLVVGGTLAIGRLVRSDVTS